MAIEPHEAIITALSETTQNRDKPGARALMAFAAICRFKDCFDEIAAAIEKTNLAFSDTVSTCLDADLCNRALDNLSEQIADDPSIVGHDPTYAECWVELGHPTTN